MVMDMSFEGIPCAYATTAMIVYSKSRLEVYAGELRVMMMLKFASFRLQFSRHAQPSLQLRHILRSKLMLAAGAIPVLCAATGTGGYLSEAQLNDLNNVC